MYLKTLSLIETYPKEKNIRTINFTKGINFIVDAGKNQEKGNSVGKTTILKIIDICLGAKDRKYIYFDEETHKTNDELKSYINDNKIKATLELISSFDNNVSQVIKLDVDLFLRGKRYINGEIKKLEEYKEELNKILFDNKINNPTFRQLINMFVRIDQKRDNHKFLKFLSQTKDITYTNIYSYLFELSDQKKSNQILEIKNNITNKTKDITDFKKLYNFNSIDIVNQKLLLLQSQANELENKIDVMVRSKEFQENEEKISEIKIEYAYLKDKLDELYFKRLKINNILDKAKNEAEETLDEEILKNLYHETNHFYKKLNKNFNDLVKFNNELMQNKINYFSKQLEKINDSIIELEKKKKYLFNKHRNIILLIEDNKLEEYSLLQQELKNLNQEIGINKNIKEMYEKLEESLNNLNDSLKKVESKSESKDDPITHFNRYFADYSKKTNGEASMIYKKEKGFPFGISTVKDGLSTGTRKSIIVSFDLAYQKFAFDINKKVPHFIIHDVIETVDQVALNAIIEIVNEVGCQYIVAVLSEKISSLNNANKFNIVAEFSESNRPFKN